MSPFCIVTTGRELLQAVNWTKEIRALERDANVMAANIEKFVKEDIVVKQKQFVQHEHEKKNASRKRPSNKETDRAKNIYIEYGISETSNRILPSTKTKSAISSRTSVRTHTQFTKGSCCCGNPEKRRRLLLPTTRNRNNCVRAQIQPIPTRSVCEFTRLIELFVEGTIECRKFPVYSDIDCGFSSIGSELDDEVTGLPKFRCEDDDCRTTKPISKWAHNMISNYIQETISLAERTFQNDNVDSRFAAIQKRLLF